MFMSRERVKSALDHKEPDRVPLDLGAARSPECKSIPSICCARR
jgi:hypothetical protein